ncbi:helix-turn-helix transcriptional regulator [Streptomyces sp. NPDC127033]|uniref:helix-turn-helix transcriptional regulator n=1 Tax=Streptomyces sp. NPDC127033 TaxID=3347110 RepID=UPI00365BA569
MRADRLVATLLFLQSRGRVTAAEVAAELAVSERTARRDLEALATAGIPVYPQRGRGGGWVLVGGARTELTGLTVGEIRELFLVAGVAPTAPEPRTPPRGLVPAPPQAPPADTGSGSGTGTGTGSGTGTGTGTDVETAPRTGAPGGAGPSPTPYESGSPHLRVLERAVVDGTQIRLGYERPGRPVEGRIVHPLGLATKNGVRYLVAGTGTGAGGLRIFRLSRITSVEPTGEPVVRPEGFDLAAAWRSLAATMEDRMRAVTVRARAERGAEALLRGLFTGRLRLGGPLPRGWMEFEVDGPTPEVLAAQLAGLGARIEVLAPPAARAHLARLGAELAALYGPPTAPRGG